MNSGDFFDIGLTREYLETRLSALEYRFDAKLAENKSSIVMWVAGMLLAQAGLIAALVKLL